MDHTAVRVAIPGDISGLLQLWQTEGVHPTVTDSADALHRLVREQPDSVFVATTESGQIVGSALAAWDGWRGSLYRVVVDPEWRRRGIATELVRQALAALASKGCARTSILVVATDAAAVAFWERCRVLGILPDPLPKLRFVFTSE